MKLFFKDADYEAFERTLAKTLEARPMRLLGYCLMPNHWHLLLWPQHDGDLGTQILQPQLPQIRSLELHHARTGIEEPREQIHER